MGKRSGEGFVTHLAILIMALTRALSDRVSLSGITVGRRGLLAYLKALGGSNTVKVVPSSVSDKRTKGIKVACGQLVSTIPDSHWIDAEKTPMALCEVKVSPKNTIIPNMGVTELADAVARALPFASRDSEKPIMSAVLFSAGEGKLSVVATDGVILSEQTLDFDGEGEALISRDDLRGVASALRKAKRVRVSFTDTELLIETDIIRYKWQGIDGNYPNYKKLIPTEHTCLAHFDTQEALGSVRALQALVGDKDATIDLTFADATVTFANPDGQGQTRMSADIDGEGYVRVNSTYLITALKSMVGMVDFALTKSTAPCLLSLDGLKAVVMPMLSEKAKTDTKAEKAEKAKAETKTEAKAPVPA